MIPTLYRTFRWWSMGGAVLLVSDTHFGDSDCKLMDEDWITPAEHIDIIKRSVHKADTLIHLGDVGDPAYMDEIPGYKVLIMGNHDTGIRKYEQYFDEVYAGPLMVGEKLLLSHEPVEGVDWAFNIHGHNHNKDAKGDATHLNLAANVVDFQVFNLGTLIKNGLISGVKSLHRDTIDRASSGNERTV